MAKPPTDEATFRAWLNHLAGTRPPRGPAALSHAKAFFDLLDNPQDFAQAVHVVGTAGKGTTAHLLTTRLVDRSLIVGTHMSPHVYDVRERFLINGQLPGWESVLGAASEVHAAVARVQESTGKPPSYFAVTAAMSWVLASRANANVLVVEAGIGGRHDATNVFSRPDRIVVVTRIGMDHTDVLGATPVEIAAEKTAVVIGSSGVVLAPQSEPGIVAVVAAAAEAAGVDMVEVEASPDGDWRADSDATAAAVETMLYGHSAAMKSSVALPPGRMEVVESGDRTFVLDGAHNATKIGGVAALLKREQAGGIQCVVVALGEKKDLESCASVLADIAPVVITTSFDTGIGNSNIRPAGTPRSWAPEKLAEAVATQPDPPRLIVAPDIDDAILQARREAARGDVILVTGSFLYLADARNAIRKPDNQISR